MVVLDAEINNLLSGCPALETIVFNSVGGFSRLEINSLKHLELSRDFHDFMCCLVDVSSVVNAKITFDITCIKGFEDDYLDSDEEDEDSCRDYHEDFKTLVQDYLQKLRYATELTFGTLFSQVLCILQFKEVPIPELECKYLALELHLEKFSLYGAAGLLRASRLVETLNISIENQPFDDSRCSFERKYLVKGDSIGLQRYISSFVFSNLKNVKIVIFSGVCLKEHAKKLFKLSNFLLKNTVVLEKFVIVSNRQRCEICGIKCMPRFLSRLANKLGSSADSVIIFQQHVDVSSVVNPKDKSDQDSDDNEEDSYGEDHQYSDDEEESCSDYFQDSDDDQDSYSDYYEDSDDMEEDNPDEDSDDMEEDKQ
ncbi:hypothetical protein KY290_001418 [Solanum tuberosum]|uniref:F-box/LRR-repeat protein n=1 Tax=Solanum tuberosum TaxID=4113 RepID=A0ABQ7WMM1_SOLTU|nr:hypothetical protein KY289_001575 [Solanum tuberosum]KAH0781820.1 hypothetical protein KY290_001418 [Solanum tuberosum]